MSYKQLNSFKNFPRLDWNSGSIKPLYPGIYERISSKIPELILFNFWNGEEWKAGINPSARTSLFQNNKSWRGIDKDTYLDIISNMNSTEGEKNASASS